MNLGNAGKQSNEFRQRGSDVAFGMISDIPAEALPEVVDAFLEEMLNHIKISGEKQRAQREILERLYNVLTMSRDRPEAPSTHSTPY